MQSYSGTTKTLRCFDCKSDFSSAAALLQHFACHTSGNNDEIVNLFCEIMSRLQHCSPAYIRKKLKLKQTSELSSKHSAQATSAALRTGHDGIEPLIYQSSASNTMTMEDDTSNTSRTCEGSEGETVPISHILTEIGARARDRKQEYSVPGDVMLIKCSLQGRLENCIVKLSTKQKNSTPTFCKNINNDKLLTPTHLMQSKQLCRLPSPSKSNPVNICFVATNGIAGHSGATQPVIKSSSCRKQTSPRKVVHRVSDVDRKDVSVCVSDHGSSESQRDGSLHEPETVGGAMPSFLECYDSKAAPGKKKYPCHLCTKMFGWSTDLKRHILTHTGERPFKCGLCQATFTRNFLLQKHEAKFHDVQVVVAPAGSRDPSSVFENGNVSSHRRLAQYRQSVARKLGNTAEHKKTDLLKVSKTKNNSAVRLDMFKKGVGSQAKSMLPSQMSSPEALNIS